METAKKIMNESTLAYERIQQTTVMEAERRAKIELDLRASIKQMQTPPAMLKSTTSEQTGQIQDPAAQLLDMAGACPAKKAQMQEAITLLQAKHFPDNMLDLIVNICKGQHVTNELPGALPPAVEEPTRGNDAKTQAMDADSKASGKGKGVSDDL